MLLAGLWFRRLGMVVAVAVALVWADGWFARVGEAPSSGPIDVPTDESGPLRPGAKATFMASAYCKGDVTASGARVRSGVAAADPKILPVGSVVHVKTDEDEHSGVYTVLDTGPAVNGREIDIYIWSCYEAGDFGRRRVEVTVMRLGWEPNESVGRGRE